MSQPSSPKQDSFIFTAGSFTDPIFEEVLHNRKPLTEASEETRQKYADKANESKVTQAMLKYYGKYANPPKPKIPYIKVGKPVMKWGKHKGTPIVDLDPNYVDWMINGENTIYESTKKFIGDIYYAAHPECKKVGM